MGASQFSMTLGNDFAGVVAAVASDRASGFAIGERVYGVKPPSRDGTHASLGGVRANSRAAQAVLASAHGQSVPIFQQLAEIIRLVVMMYVRFPLSLRNVEDLLAERGVDISHETVGFW
jgi:hypothetical protein